jgi:hypothetical protein
MPSEEIAMANGHGGARPGAGRKKGQKDGHPRNCASVRLSTQLRERASATGETPLEFFCSIMHDESQPQELRIAAAQAALPYMHPRLAMIAARVEEERRRAVEEINEAFRERPRPQ